MSLSEDSKRSDGIILGFWDHENTVCVIKELEETVNSAEKKCAALMQELMNYKKYYQKWSLKNLVSVNLKKKREKSSQDRDITKTTSDNHIQQNQSFNIDKDQIFYEKLKGKISEVNDEITYVNLKIGFQNNILFPAEEFRKNLKNSVNLENNASSTIFSELENLSSLFKLTKSDPTAGDMIDKSELLKKCNYSKITKDELALYQKLSNNYLIDKEDQSGGESLRKMKSESLQNPSKIEDKVIQPVLALSEPIFKNQNEFQDNLPKSKIKKGKKMNKPSAFNIGKSVEKCISLINEKKIEPDNEVTLNVEVPEKNMKAISDLFILANNFDKKFNKSVSADNCKNFTKAVDLIFKNKETNRKQRFKHTSIGFASENRNSCVNFAKKKILGSGDGNSNNYKEELKTELSTIHSDLINLHRKYASLRDEVAKNMEDDLVHTSDMKLKATDYEDLINYYAKMLQIINAGSPDVILNNWEKTSPIIKELEQTVNFAERKYGDLMQQLNFYKQYWSQQEKFSNKSEVRIQRKTKKKNKNVIISNSSSDSDLKQEPQRINQHFYEKLKNKISKINNEITEANKKLGLKPAEESKENNRPQDDSHKLDEPEKEEFPNKTTKSEPALTVEKKSSSIKMCQKSSTKSIPLKTTNFKKRHVPLLRRRHSSLQPYKIRSKSLPQGVRRKFGFGSFLEVTESRLEPFKKPEFVKPKKMSTEKIIKKASFKTRKTKVFPTKINKSNVEIPAKKEIPRRKSVSQNNIPYSKELKKDSKIFPSRDFSQIHHVEGSSTTNVPNVKEDNKILEKQNRNFERKPSTIISLAKQPIPFTICASTSKSFNLGLNIQQVLSMVKQKKRSLTLQGVLKDNIQTTRSVLEKNEPEIDTLFVGKARSRLGSEICPAREENEDCLSCITENFETRSRCTILSKARSQYSEQNKIKSLIDPNSVPKYHENTGKIKRPEDVWVVEQPDSNSACRTKSKCTCFPSKQCVDYNKVIKQYTGWRLPIAKSEILNSDFCGARFTFNGNQLYPIPSQENIYQFPRTINGNQNGVKAELMKLQNDLMNLHRKYALLREKIAQSNLDDLEAQAELDAMESEINSREAEYKDIINFYSQLLSLKERLKFLRGKNNGSLSLSVIQHRSRKDPLRPTPSMALTKVLRQIQCLQDKIKLTETP